MQISTRYTLNEFVRDPKDWQFTWGLKDDVRLESCCDFCGQQEQRLTYEVARGDDRMWVCQRCVGRYPIGGEREGNVLDLRAARDYIHGLTARLKQRTCHDIIREVQCLSADPAMEETLVYYERNLMLSPQRAAVLFAAMTLLTERIDVRIFEIQTRSKAHQDEFGTLADAERMIVWPALSAQQRRRLVSLGHAPSSVVNKRGRLRPEIQIELTGSCMSALTASADMTRRPDKLIKTTV
ncbi:MAG: hypothetical protein P0Y65_05965 [Candidatus Devosia phytovorans]|uniref:Uncharacterized protein n=1 Tax=Candidatus Devosia phytovorans TaxID=3121372 RepID=A0AAJ5VX38_9HYPH|nr:hypothetical protein [Devosia sp.]WEK05800.1 MAG: hypothetical protein P0Y65_05965 [Devosia sp.]